MLETDHILSWQYLYDRTIRLESDRAELIAALECLDLATVRIGSFAPDNERKSLIYAQDKARDILKRMQS